jgi:hypothetical protein
VNPVVEFAAGNQLWGVAVYLAVGSLVGWNLLSIRLLLYVRSHGFVTMCLALAIMISFITTLLIGWLISLKDPALTILEGLAFLIALALVLAFWKRAKPTTSSSPLVP